MHPPNHCILSNSVASFSVMWPTQMSEPRQQMTLPAAHVPLCCSVNHSTRPSLWRKPTASPSPYVQKQDGILGQVLCKLLLLLQLGADTTKHLTKHVRVLHSKPLVHGGLPVFHRDRNPHTTNTAQSLVHCHCLATFVAATHDGRVGQLVQLLSLRLMSFTTFRGTTASGDMAGS